MNYVSTRGIAPSLTASQAILQGLAPDGGLYVPEEFPTLPCAPEEMKGLPYQEIACRVMAPFLTDYTEEELRGCIDRAYDAKFDTPAIAPLAARGGLVYLELWHGATIAFKDMALSILPHLMVTAARKNGVTDEICILTATSGDTGKAAMAGFADVPGTRIIVFYPKDGVSAFQERQMRTQKGENTAVVGVDGNFDDCQTGVKKMFGDEAFREAVGKAGIRFSSANSINIGRLVPQVAYYVAAYVRLLEEGMLQVGEPMNVTVPTGNFGNILAAYYAKRMGLPIGRLVCASNENKVLFDFFRTGEYDRNRPFVLTTSPSMDILISSNLERLIYEIAGRDAAAVRERMAELSATGVYTITEEMAEKLADFFGETATEEEVLAQIGRVYDEAGYVIDPHTAVGSVGACKFLAAFPEEAEAPMLVASTASPCKFAQAVCEALVIDADGLDDLARIDKMAEVTGIAIPAAVEEVRTAPIRHSRFCAVEEMKQTVAAILGL